MTDFVTFSLGIYIELFQKNHIMSLLIIFHAVVMGGYVFRCARDSRGHEERLQSMTDLGKTGLNWKKNKAKYNMLVVRRTGHIFTCSKKTFTY